ncbi:hypothetical protein [Niallia sp. FSL R7-0271]|uniref:hypothetical protein n=1 Tax=Niallia sp. FSL R7-0271 TaxID=2921678 RepID=UPI0030FBCA75
MANKFANQMIEIDYIETDIDFEEVEGLLTKQLDDSFTDLELLENERKLIADPDSLGKVVLDEVWKQFGNQIGLDMTNESLVQKYDREHPEQYKDIAGSVLQDQQYKDANKVMKEQQKAGTLKDEYTGKNFKRNENANLDHVVSRKELFENQRRKQANLSVADLANKEENLKATNESLNKSKGAKSNKEYVEKRELREKDLIKQNERANKKIDESNISDVDKRLQKEENNKRLKNKLAADAELMIQAEKEARKAIDKDITINATKEVGKKAGKDALKAMAVSAFFTLLKEIMNGLIRFFKVGSKSFNGFLSEMRVSLKSFFSKISSFFKTGASTLIGTIISEIFGPIVSVFKKLASVIKQGVSSLIDAVNYLRDKKNKDKPFSVKVAQVGKIITVGLVGGSALFLGEVIEKFLLTVPGMQIEIPLMGSLANLIGLFLSSLVSGLVGAIVLNLIDKFIAKKVKEVKDQQIIEKKNGIMNLQQVQSFVAENRVAALKENVINEISDNHALAKDLMQQSLNKIFDDNYASGSKNKNTITENQRELIQMQKDLEDLL